MVRETADVFGNPAYECSVGEEMDLGEDGVFTPVYSPEPGKCSMCGFKRLTIRFCDMFPCMAFQREDKLSVRYIQYKEVKNGQ